MRSVPQSTAEFISSRVIQLAALAEYEGMNALAYILKMAELEVRKTDPVKQEKKGAGQVRRVSEGPRGGPAVCDRAR